MSIASKSSAETERAGWRQQRGCAPGGFRVLGCTAVLLLSAKWRLSATISTAFRLFPVLSVQLRVCRLPETTAIRPLLKVFAANSAVPRHATTSRKTGRSPFSAFRSRSQAMEKVATAVPLAVPQFGSAVRRPITMVLFNMVYSSASSSAMMGGFAPFLKGKTHSGAFAENMYRLFPVGRRLAIEKGQLP